MSNRYILTSILVMAVVTYLIRVLPMAIFRKKIQNRFVQSFLSYVPYSVLAAMTFPAILTATSAGIISGAAALIVALIVAYKEKSLLTVAVCACAAVFIAERIMEFSM